jgi:predicted metal-dependent enzyme (double-stranded beta helix superfamily)
VTRAAGPTFDAVRSRIDDAVRAPNVTDIAHQVKSVLEDAMRCDSLTLPANFHVPLADTYARRLLHRDPEGRYTVVAMTWGPGQQTALHDHAGIWCVECVVHGEMEVTQYDLLTEADGEFRFEEQRRVTAGRGSAGCLIPPFEYHTLANARRDSTSVTLHVYGGEMDHCHVFEPSGDGTYRRVTRTLRYHD